MDGAGEIQAPETPGPEEHYNLATTLAGEGRISIPPEGEGYDKAEHAQ